jgi:uncharacterized cysteine cluster protein YcgN (CxxCxxCC family)
MNKFWEEKTLSEMSTDEWDRLCDGCARCCVLKEQDENTGEVTYTDIACRYLDLESCRCTCYEDRKKLVPECINLSPEKAKHFAWLPSTCAYRLLHEGRTLPEWHPLISGNENSARDAGMSIRNRVVSERDAFEI